jgi:hypothetical protein
MQAGKSDKFQIQKLAQQFCFQDRIGMVVLHWCRTFCFADCLIHGGATDHKRGISKAQKENAEIPPRIYMNDRLCLIDSGN